MSVLVLADVAQESGQAKLGDVTAKALTAALAMGGPVHVLVAGQGVAAAAEQAAGPGGRRDGADGG